MTSERPLVLVIDDEDCVREVVRKTLERQGFEVACARNGAEGMAAFRERQGEVRVVLLDVHMPVKHGIDTLRELMNERPAPAVIGISGFDKPAPGDFPAMAFLAKPFTCDALVKTVLAVIEAEDAEAAAGRSS